MPAFVGIVLFLLVVVVLLGLQFALGRYGVGREREVRDVTTNTNLRDVNAGFPADGILPYTSNRDPSPRDRLREPPE